MQLSRSTIAVNQSASSRAPDHAKRQSITTHQHTSSRTAATCKRQPKTTRQPAYAPAPDHTQGRVPAPIPSNCPQQLITNRGAVVLALIVERPPSPCRAAAEFGGQLCLNLQGHAKRASAAVINQALEDEQSCKAGTSIRESQPRTNSGHHHMHREVLAFQLPHAHGTQRIG